MGGCVIPRDDADPADLMERDSTTSPWRDAVRVTVRSAPLGCLRGAVTPAKPKRCSCQENVSRDVPHVDEMQGV